MTQITPIRDLYYVVVQPNGDVVDPYVKNRMEMYDIAIDPTIDETGKFKYIKWTNAADQEQSEYFKIIEQTYDVPPPVDPKKYTPQKIICETYENMLVIFIRLTKKKYEKDIQRWISGKIDFETFTQIHRDKNYSNFPTYR